MPHTINAILFDLDNTLANREDAFRRWAQHFARDQLDLTEPSEIEEAVSALIVLDADGYTSRVALFRAIAEHYACPGDSVDIQIQRYREQFVGYLPPLDAGAAALLRALNEAAVPWGIVTNGSSRSQRDKIRKLVLERQAACVVVSEEIGLRKPDPAMFRTAARQLGVRDRDVLFVGDHPHSDIAGAARVGMRTAWLRRGRSWPTELAAIAPDHIIDSLDELLWVVRGRAGTGHPHARTHRDRVTP